METKKLTNKEVLELTIKMLDDAKGTIKGDEDVILGDEDGLGMISYDLLWISALPKALSKAAGSCPSQIKDNTMLMKLLLPFKRLKEINERFNDYLRSKKPDDEIENLIEELDHVANEIVDSKLEWKEVNI